jgi:hypothetical protein
MDLEEKIQRNNRLNWCISRWWNTGVEGEKLQGNGNVTNEAVVSITTGVTWRPRIKCGRTQSRISSTVKYESIPRNCPWKTVTSIFLHFYGKSVNYVGPRKGGTATSTNSPSFCMTFFSGSLTNRTTLLSQSRDCSYYVSRPIVVLHCPADRNTLMYAHTIRALSPLVTQARLADYTCAWNWGIRGTNPAILSFVKGCIIFWYVVFSATRTRSLLLLLDGEKSREKHSAYPLPVQSSLTIRWHVRYERSNLSVTSKMVILRVSLRILRIHSMSLSATCVKSKR